MKTYLTKLSDFQDKEEFVKDIQHMESIGNELFTSNPLVVQAEKV